MSTFEAPIVEVTVEPHPNADRLVIGIIDGYRCVTGKNDNINTGDIAVYIPDSSIVPSDLLEEMGLTGALSGAAKNRVKPRKFRGELSEGLLYRGSKLTRLLSEGARVGDDVADALGIEKYTPAVPQSFQGKARGNAPTVRFDVENYKKHSRVLQENEPVVATEKIHGTWCGLGIDPGYGPIVSSKGLSKRDIALDVDEESNQLNNVYVRTWNKYKDTIQNLYDFASAMYGPAPVHILGEVYGPGIQHLTYGTNEIEFRAFDIKIGDSYMDSDQFESTCENYGIPMVPVVYKGPWNFEELEKLSMGDSMLTSKHHREGIVVRSAFNRRDDRLGRVMLKMIQS